ncbi:MAG: T9SS type A sorting domain-containing protein [Bacteroidia bacterium]|nr:T9SS type A sorting domain-containing protein [Bacteroidia bacterium]
MLALMILMSFTGLLQAQNPQVVNGVATYTSNKTIGSQFLVPNNWTKIVIKAGVTLTGSFYMPTRTSPIEIMGENWNTSVIQGTGATQWHAQGNTTARQHSAIRCDKSPDVFIHDLKSYNPDKFHISAGFGNVTVDHCRLIDDRERHTTDGVHGGRQKTVVKNCYIDTHDDALYLSECNLVENTTIVHNKNGSPLQVSWGYDDFDGHTCIVRNVTVIDAYNGSNYNQGVVSWASRNNTGPVTINVDFQGSFTRQTQNGAVQSHMYQLGRNAGGFNNSTIKVSGLCNWQNSIIKYGTNNNSQVQITGCGGGGGSSAPIGATIALQAKVNGKYVWMQQDYGDQLIAQGPGTGNNDKKFVVVNAGNGLVALKSKKNNSFVTATDAGSGILKATGGSIQAWEKFQWVQNSDGSISLKADINGQYVSAENAGNSPLIANRSSIGLWEKFDVITISAARQEADPAPQIGLYPNPATDILMVTGITEQVPIQILTLQGAVVMESIGGPKLNISTLASGIYVLRIEGQHLTFVKQ